MAAKLFVLEYNDRQINYNVQYTKRKTIGIEVCNNSNVTIKSPFNTPDNLIKQIVRKKFNWITKKIAYFKEITTSATKKQYINNAPHLYLGKEYPLKLFLGKNSINLVDCYLQITSQNLQPEKLEQLLQKWYLKQANCIFSNIFAQCWNVFSNKVSYNKPKPLLKIKKLKSRWGSCSMKNKISLNSELIKTDISCIEYVIMHELCHLIHFNHSKSFYILLNSLMPDWKKHDLQLNKFCVL